MKTILLSFLLSFLAISSFGALAKRDGVALASIGKIDTVTKANVGKSDGQTVPHGPPPLYLLREGFEGAGYENVGWSVTGAPDPNATTPTPSEGSQCFTWSVAGEDDAIMIITATDEVWARLRYQKSGDPTFPTGRTIGLLNSDGSLFIRVTVGSGALVVLGEQGNLASTAGFVNNATWYYVWVHYRKSDHSVSAAFSTSLSEPTSGTAFCSTTSFVGTFTVTKIAIGGGGQSPIVEAIDELLVNNIVIGDTAY